MRQLATILMFAAWLLYGAMPATAMPSMQHEMPGQMAMPVVDRMPDDHSGHDVAAPAASSEVAMNHGHDDAEKPCPHGSKICVAPFCSACLVVLPNIGFADTGRFIHRYPPPETGPSLVVSGSAPLTPPPRA